MHFYSLVTLGLMSTAFALTPQNNAARDMPIVPIKQLHPLEAPGSGGFKSARAYDHETAPVVPTATSSTIPSSTAVTLPSEIPVAREPVAVRAAIRTYYADYRKWEAATGDEKTALRAKVQDDLLAVKNIKGATLRQEAKAKASASAFASASASATPGAKRR
ncbi:hypothetical protein N7490_011822 [Penicillium lividum]|nr:hypothetical protein N7490_011822 [Penicillium lividum]